jgi:hypothetical protein
MQPVNAWTSDDQWRVKGCISIIASLAVQWICMKRVCSNPSFFFPITDIGTTEVIKLRLFRLTPGLLGLRAKSHGAWRWRLRNNDHAYRRADYP